MRLLLFFLVIFLSISELSSQVENNVLSKIVIQKKDNFITLRAQVENESLLFKDQLSYNFIALKKGEKGNFSNNKQSGEFSLKPNEQKELAVIKVGINNKEELRSYLFIKYKNKLISKDTLWLSSEINKQSSANIAKEEDFLLKGIVINDAITKIGTDFYDFFYQEYLLRGIKYSFILNIKEKPGLARSSIIYVEVGDLKIHEFFAKPDEDYLKNNVKIVLQRTSVYAKRRKALRRASKI